MRSHALGALLTSVAVVAVVVAGCGTTAEGEAVTVTLTAQTAFGTKEMPATQAQFPVGSPVRVSGSRSGSGFAATRIAAPAAQASL